ncbi:MAG: hypothetical protein ACI9SB_000078 [Candidatus Azotimanducaceae bacterium]|jgi:hypothetical protein
MNRHMNRQVVQRVARKTSRVLCVPVALLIKRGVATIALCLIGATSSFAAELPQSDSQKHLGVASCASGVCHGSVRPRASTRVLQNEYVTWSQRDRHRIAYQTLLTSQSQQIAANLGLPNAHEASVCLDCHADNVAPAQQGARFQISDGVGCEACHGGSEHYISTHADSDRERQVSLDAGLYPADDTQARAQLCMSCHIGTPEKMASHDIMGAGHPRLSFELDTFSILQPAHYVVDEDYRASKSHSDSMTTWVTGQTHGALQTLQLISTRLDKGGLFPELALFDCHACHHSMNDIRWQSDLDGQLPAGSIRLNDANFLMLFAIAGVVSEPLEATLRKQVTELHQSVAARRPLAKLIADITSSIQKIEVNGAFQSSPESATKLLSALVAAGGDDRFRDYVAAEQVVMAIDLLLSTAGLREVQSDWLSRLYEQVSDEDSFMPGELTVTMLEFES